MVTGSHASLDYSASGPVVGLYTAAKVQMLDPSDFARNGQQFSAQLFQSKPRVKRT